MTGKVHGHGIDHLVLAVRDLDAAAERFAALGFTLTPTAYHPFGTANRLAIMDGNFVELLGVADPAKIPPPDPQCFGFAQWNRDFLSRREGISMLVLDSDDPEGDRARFRERGLQSWDPTTFSRGAVQPDGSEETVSFTLCFAVGPRVPSIPSFVCRHHAPQHFWKPAFQRHANGATAIASVTVAAEDTVPVRDYYAALLGEGAVETDGERSVARTARGAIEVIPRAALRARYEQAAPADPGPAPAFVGMSIAVGDLSAARAAAEDAGVSFHEAGGVVRVAARDARDTVLEFTG